MDDDLVFKLKPAHWSAREPAHGRLERMSQAGIAITQFTQAEVAAGTILYAHDDTETVTDQFTFSVEDNACALECAGVQEGDCECVNNLLPYTRFEIQINPVNDHLPDVITNNGAEVVEGWSLGVGPVR